MKNIAIFASGSGTNFKSIYHHVQLGEIPGQIVLTISNNSDSGAIEFATGNNMPTLIINEARYPKQVDRYELLIQTLGGNDVDLICLAGYMKLLPKSIVHKYHNRILNIHKPTGSTKPYENKFKTIGNKTENHMVSVSFPMFFKLFPTVFNFISYGFQFHFLWF